MCNCALGIRHVAHAYDTGTTSNLPCQCFPVVNNTILQLQGSQRTNFECQLNKSIE